MPLDPSIALGVRPIQVADPLAQYGQIAQLQNYQTQNQLHQMQMREAEATAQERNALRQLNPSASDYETQLFKVSPQLGIQYRKEQSAAEASRASTAASKITSAKAKQEMLGQAWRDISSRPSDANITAHLEDILLSPLYDDAEKASIRARGEDLLKLPFEQRQTTLAQIGSKPSDLRPHFNVGPTGIVQTPAFGGPATVVQGTGAAFQATPAQIEANRIAQQRVGLEGQRVGLESQRVELAKKEDIRKEAGLENLPPKEIQKRESALPQATSSIKGFESKSNSFVKDLEKLRDHPGLNQITGIAAGRLPAVTSEGRAAQALYDKIVAKGGFQALQDLRDASKTGGALGNVSNQEGEYLRNAFAPISRTQDTGDLKRALINAANVVTASKQRMRDAYDMTYDYKTGGAPPSQAKPVAGQNALTPAEQTELDQLRKRFGGK
jgi:hypothetical protein